MASPSVSGAGGCVLAALCRADALPDFSPHHSHPHITPQDARLRTHQGKRKQQNTVQRGPSP